MKMVIVVETESGVKLLDKEDGFIITGSLFKADGESGLVGDANTCEILASYEVRSRAYTNFEFLDTLCLDLEVFKEYIERREQRIRR